jgi:hypothetical protein
VPRVHLFTPYINARLPQCVQVISGKVEKVLFSIVMAGNQENKAVPALDCELYTLRLTFIDAFTHIRNRADVP